MTSTAEPVAAQSTSFSDGVVDKAAVASAFVKARREGCALNGYPFGVIPATLEEAYQIQDMAIGLWSDDDVSGWKVGRIMEPHASQLGAERLVGPIFSRNVWQASGGAPVRFPVFVDGFAAVEAEYVIVAAADADPQKLSYSIEEAAALAGAMHVAVETAGSPLATINELGPTVVVSDFGNNAGLIVGPAIADWQSLDLESLRCETFIEGASVGQGGAANIPGGPLEAFRFALEITARRGLPLRKGQMISTGATTGIHDIVAGQKSYVTFSGGEVLHCVATPVEPAA